MARVLTARPPAAGAPAGPSTRRLLHAIDAVAGLSERQNPGPQGLWLPAPTPLSLPRGFSLVYMLGSGRLLSVELRHASYSWAGNLGVDAIHDGAIWGQCRRDLVAVAEAAGVSGIDACYVAASHLHEDLRGRGLGAAMYASAVHLAAREFRAALMSNDCVSARTKTSMDARRVWNSRALAAVAHVSGEVAYARMDAMGVSVTRATGPRTRKRR